MPCKPVQFTPCPTAYLNHIASRIAGRLWWLILFPAALIAGGLVADWRWAVVGLMLLLIVYPMVMTLAVLRYAANRQLAGRSSASAVSLDPPACVTLYRRPDPESEPQPIEKITVTNVEYTSRFIVMTTGASLSDVILIPRSCGFEPPELPPTD